MNKSCLFLVLFCYYNIVENVLPGYEDPTSKMLLQRISGKIVVIAEVGTPPQKFRMQIDTFLDHNILISRDYKTEGNLRCDNTARYINFESLTSIKHEKIEIVQGIHKLSGDHFQDIIGIFGEKQQLAKLIVLTKVPNEDICRSGIDGIISFGPQINSGILIPGGNFGLYINKNETSMFTGLLTFGGIRDDLFANLVGVVKSAHKNKLIFTIDQILCDEQALKLIEKGKNLLVNPSIENILVTEDYDQINNMMGFKFNGERYFIECSKIDKIKDITFKAEGVRLSFNGNDISEKKDNICFSFIGKRFSPGVGSEFHMVLGQVAIKKYGVHFKSDDGNGKISFFNSIEIDI